MEDYNEFMEKPVDNVQTMFKIEPKTIVVSTTGLEDGMVHEMIYELKEKKSYPYKDVFPQHPRNEYDRMLKQLNCTPLGQALFWVGHDKDNQRKIELTLQQPFTHSLIPETLCGDPFEWRPRTNKEIKQYLGIIK